MGADGNEDVVRSSKDLFVLETQNGKAVALQEGVPPHVMATAQICLMAVSVDLDHQPCREPCEVGNVRSDWSLPSKTGTIRAEVPQHVPHGRFGPGQFASKSSCPHSRLGIDVGVRHANSSVGTDPSPTPPHKGEGLNPRLPSRSYPNDAPNSETESGCDRAAIEAPPPCGEGLGRGLQTKKPTPHSCAPPAIPRVPGGRSPGIPASRGSPAGVRGAGWIRSRPSPGRGAAT